jgi:outer membrane protein assembly factor BamD
MNRLHSLMLAAGTFVLAGCGGGRAGEAGGASGTVPAQRENSTPQQVDSLYRLAESRIRHAKWGDAIEELERLLLEFSPGDPRIPKARYFLGEAKLGIGSHLEAAREFRRVSDETPNDALAPEALLRVGDVYTELWRRPELDPSYGQTALATYQELLNRYSGSPAAARAQARIEDLQERFAYKEYRAALYYYKLKAYDSAILYLKDVVATYPRASVAPDALLKLVEAYRRLGYQEDVRETCGYLRRFHPNSLRRESPCRADTTGTS